MMKHDVAEVDKRFPEIFKVRPIEETDLNGPLAELHNFINVNTARNPNLISMRSKYFFCELYN